MYLVTAGLLPWVFKHTYPTVAVQMVDGFGEAIAHGSVWKNLFQRANKNEEHYRKVCAPHFIILYFFYKITFLMATISFTSKVLELS